MLIQESFQHILNTSTSTLRLSLRGLGEADFFGGGGGGVSILGLGGGGTTLNLIFGLFFSASAVAFVIFLKSPLETSVQ